MCTTAFITATNLLLTITTAYGRNSSHKRSGGSEECRLPTLTQAVMPSVL